MEETVVPIHRTAHGQLARDKAIIDGTRERVSSAITAIIEVPEADQLEYARELAGARDHLGYAGNSLERAAALLPKLEDTDTKEAS
jgi:hypothetical protein